MVVPGTNGFVYTAGSIDELSGCLLKLLENPALLETMKAASLLQSQKLSYAQAARGLLEASDSVKRPVR
jgi:hypothetical protein